MRVIHVQILPAPREKVYATLLDPEALRACIEGLDSLTPAGPDVFEAVLLRGAYRGRVEIRDPVPPASLRLEIEGKGGLGSVRIAARLSLQEKDGGTELAGEGDVTAGGLLAALGPRLLEAEVKRRLADFLAKVNDYASRKR